MTALDQLLARTAVRNAAPGRLRDVGVAFDGGGAVLTGVADDWHAKQLAQEALLRAGVRVRANRIAVGPRPPAPS